LEALNATTYSVKENNLLGKSIVKERGKARKRGNPDWSEKNDLTVRFEKHDYNKEGNL